MEGQNGVWNTIPKQSHNEKKIENMARRGGFEPPSPFGQWISNPSPCRAGPSPLWVLRKSISFLKVFILTKILDFSAFIWLVSYRYRLPSCCSIYYCITEPMSQDRCDLFQEHHAHLIFPMGAQQGGEPQSICMMMC